GQFNPATAGGGTHTITYTIACGSESIEIVVSDCIPPTACLEPNGDITVTGGVGPYTWQQQTTVQNCSACIFGCAIDAPPGCAVDETVWTTFATGVTATPPGTWPIQLTDAAGNTLIINDPSDLPPCSDCPAITVTPSNVNHISCHGETDGS